MAKHSEKIKISVPILKFDEVNKNNRIYVKELTKNMPHHVDIYDEMPSYEPTYDMNIGKTSFGKKIGTAMLNVIGDAVVTDCLIDTEAISKLIESGKSSIRTFGIGFIKDNIVVDYELQGVALTDNPA